MKNIVAAAVAFLLSTSQLPGQSPRSAEALLGQVQADGARTVLSQLWGRPADFDGVLLAIETGDARWLELAAELRGAADGAASLSLDFAVARAIPHNPSGVLSLIGNGFPFNMVCTSPFIEPQSGVAELYERRATAALQSVQGRLASLAAQCAASVRMPKESQHGPSRAPAFDFILRNVIELRRSSDVTAHVRIVSAEGVRDHRDLVTGRVGYITFLVSAEVIESFRGNVRGRVAFYVTQEQPSAPPGDGEFIVSLARNLNGALHYADESAMWVAAKPELLQALREDR